jgi:hypothetical protein
MSAQLHSPFLDLLKQIESGVTIFEPFGRTPEKLREFDDTVRACVRWSGSDSSANYSHRRAPHSVRNRSIW